MYDDQEVAILRQTGSNVEKKYTWHSFMNCMNLVFSKSYKL